MAYSSASGKIEIRWPANLDPHDLQSTDDLTSGTWQPVTSPEPQFEDTNWVIEISPTASARFFRLAR